MMPPVIILAGGLGTRLRTVTHDRLPKPMIPVAYQGKRYPFLSFLLSRLRDQEIRRVILCVDHLADQIVNYFGDGGKYGLEISYDYAGHASTGSRVKHALKELPDRQVLIHCGDVFHPLNIDHFIAHFHQHPENLMQVAVHRVNESEYSRANLGIDEHQQVISYKSPKTDKNLLALGTGVLLARRQILSCIPDSPDTSLTKDLYPVLIDNKSLGGYESSADFFDVGTPSEYSQFCVYAEHKMIKPLVEYQMQYA